MLAHSYFLTIYTFFDQYVPQINQKTRWVPMCWPIRFKAHLALIKTMHGYRGGPCRFPYENWYAPQVKDMLICPSPPPQKIYSAHPDIFLKTVFFHQNMNKISFYKFFIVHTLCVSLKIQIVYYEKFSGGWGWVGQIMASLTCCMDPPPPPPPPPPISLMGQ